jgi:hypothetical protein
MSKPVYLKPQAAVYLNNTNELLEEINKAEANNSDTVWITNPGKGNGRTGICLWYAKALYERIK